MPNKKKKSMASKPKKTKNIFKKARNLSFGKLFAFALILASIGALLIYQSFAAPTPMEPEQKFGMTGAQLVGIPRAERLAKLNEMRNIKVKWIKIDINWATIQPAGPGDGNWGGYDSAIDDIRAYGIRILGNITYAPLWAVPSGIPAACKREKACFEHYAPVNPAQYGDFARKVALRYARGDNPKVQHFEIWNEANNDEYFKLLTQNQRIPKYVSMLRDAKNKIKTAGVAPNAVIISSGLAPYGEVGQMQPGGYRINPVTFLAAMYYAGAKGSFDAVGWHPYNFNSGAPGQPVPWNAWHQMYGTNPSARSLMNQNGDGNKRIWMTEWGYASVKSGGNVTDEQGQATYLAQGYRNVQNYAWAGPLFWFSWEDGAGGGNAGIFDKFGIVTYLFGIHKKPAYYSYLLEATAAANK